MRFKWLHDFWVSVFTLGSIVVASLWLALHHELDLYVHPRYILFTTILCGLAVICMIGTSYIHKETPRLGKRTKPLHAIIPTLCIMLCLGMLIMRPSSLTSSAATQRGVNSGALTLNTTSPVTDLSDSSTAFGQFSVKEWASLLVQTNDTALFQGKPVHVTGFVSPAPDGNANVFYVSRFVITCCAVDARPVGVPVYQPHWQSTYKTDQWLELQGEFVQNPDGTAIPNVVKPNTITQVSEPSDPYVY